MKCGKFRAIGLHKDEVRMLGARLRKSGGNVLLIMVYSEGIVTPAFQIFQPACLVFLITYSIKICLYKFVL
jgi:hypothetical protein